MNSLGYILIHNDMWEDCGKIFKVLSYYKDGESTGIHLELQTNDGLTEKRTVPEAYIEWIQEGDLNVDF